MHTDADSTTPPAGDKKPASPPPRKKRRSLLRQAGVILLAFILLLTAARPFMPRAIRWYVNRTLDRNPLYQGKIGDVTLHLWRGAYTIHDVSINKITGNVPVPFYAARQVDFQIEWRALLHRRLVGRVLMQNPELNFVDSPDPSNSQTGEGGPWLKMIRDLFPFKINSAEVRGGAVHFRTFDKKEPVDVYLSHLDATIDNLTNINDEVTPLVTTVNARALAMEQARFDYQMKLDPFSYRPTYHMATRLIGLDLTKINNIARGYGAFDFERGWLDLVIEIDSKEGQVRGYVKPLFRDIKVLSLAKDIREDNPLQFFWEALVGGVTTLLKNPPRNQFGTLIPFTATPEGGQSTDLMATLGNVLRNAFIRAYMPRLQPEALNVEEITFEPPQVSDPISPGETQ
jgi:hypothetical protein